MNKQIYLSTEKKNEIARVFKVSRQTVWYALTYRTKSNVANMLRAAAMQRGGIVINGEGGCEPKEKFNTYFNEVPRQMVQVFSPRVRIVADMECGGITIEVDGKVVKRYGDVPISELHRIQAEARAMVETLR